MTAADRHDMQHVAELFDQAGALMNAGLGAQAAQSQLKAAEVVRQLVQRNPDDMTHLHALASVLYGLGSMLNSIDDPAGAVLALEECEQAYTRLHESGELDASRFLADVHARKGLALLSQGFGASAVVELDQAVTTYIGLWSGTVDDPHYPALARVLSINAVVLQACGDPDIAVASAEQCMRIYLSLADAVSGTPEALVHARHLRTASVIASEIHSARGRLEPALIADEVSVRTAGVLAATESPADVSALAAALTRQGLHLLAAGRAEEARPLLSRGGALRPAAAAQVHAQWEEVEQGEIAVTAADSLKAAVSLLGADRVSGTVHAILTDPMAARATVTSSGRCDVQLAPAFAEMLARLAVLLMPTGPQHGLRLGLEAHFLFAAASRAQATAMAYQFDDYGAAWAQALLECSRVFSEVGGRPMALDLARWCGGVMAGLEPFVAGDPQVEVLVRECAEQLDQLEALEASAER